VSGLLWAALAHAGTVTLAARGSGERIGDVDVTIVVGGVETTAHANADGVLALDGLPADGHVRLIAPDHAPLDVTLPLPDGLKLFFEPRPPYTIVVEAFQDTPHVARHKVDAEMALETPGTAEDSFRLVQSLPGVAVRRELSPSAAELAVRGSGPGDNRAYLDGVEIPYLYHYNQYASVLPTSLIGELELFGSTFGASYGDSVGAVVEARSIDRVPNALHGHVGLNPFMGSASVEGALREGPDGETRWWGAAAARRSYQDLFGEASPQYPVWPTFHDYHARAEHVGDQGKTAIFAYGAGDRYDRAAGELDVLDPVEQTETPTFSYRRGFDVAGAMHRFSGATRGRAVAAFVADRNRGELSTGGSERRHTSYLSSRLDLATEPSDAIRVDAGYELRAERTSLVVVPAGPDGLRVAEEAPALGRGVAVDHTQLRARVGLYGQLAWSPGDFAILPGVRVGLDTMSTPITVEPRLAARWHLADQAELKVAAGRYHQSPETEHLMPGTGTPTLGTTGSWQVAIGLEKTFADRLELLVDLWGKTLEHPLLFPNDAPATAVDGGLAGGVEILTRYRLRERFFLWGWIGVSRSELHDGDQTVPGEGDQRVNAGVVASWDVTTRWQLGLRWRLGSGLPYTPITGSLYDGGRDTWTPILGAPNGARLPLYQKLDLRVAHTFVWDRWSLEWATELWYVPKASAQLYPTWSYDYGEQGYVVGPSFVPLMSARATF
jgi:hypothetical protein